MTRYIPPGSVLTPAAVSKVKEKGYICCENERKIHLVANSDPEVAGPTGHSHLPSCSDNITARPKKGHTRMIPVTNGFWPI